VGIKWRGGGGARKANLKNVIICNWQSNRRRISFQLSTEFEVGDDSRERRGPINMSRNSLSFLVAGSVLLGAGALVTAGDAATTGSIHGFKAESITGEEIDLRQYRDRVVMVVNVASQ
jgi:hypothetical protein